ncbi:MAG TPA: aspartate kinase [Williamwhitmania sp.]|nr:aspartate kinase [Williamwhitmania sp.]
MKVLKFGGTSVGSAERMKSLTKIIPAGEQVVVVLSAMAGTTNMLVDIADIAIKGDKEKAQASLQEVQENYLKVISELYQTEEYQKNARRTISLIFNDAFNAIETETGSHLEKLILSIGEIISTNLFHLYLWETGIPSVLLPSLSYMRIDKDGEPDMYYVSENISRLMEEAKEMDVYITQGFICRNAKGEIDNLKRGGSDYTAAIIGNAINAEEVQIWTDIDGFHNNDPRYVSNTKPIRNLSFDEAAELAYFGAKILHPATIHPCRKKGIPVLLKNTLEPENPGTLITASYQASNLKAVAAKSGITAIKIRSSRMLMAHGFLKRVFEVFDSYKTSVDMITTSEVAVSLTIDDDARLPEIVAELEQFSVVEVDLKQAIICIVGDFVAERPGSALKIMEALHDIPIRMISYGGSSHNISLLVSEEHKIPTLQLIQPVLNESQPENQPRIEGFKLIS